MSDENNKELKNLTKRVEELEKYTGGLLSGKDIRERLVHRNI